jgi:hypothetical protein
VGSKYLFKNKYLFVVGWAGMVVALFPSEKEVRKACDKL